MPSGKGKGKGKPVPTADVDNEPEDKIHQRMRFKCPNYCSSFECFMDEPNNCNDECKKLDHAKALICDICNKECNDKQKEILLDTKYLENKKEEYSKDVLVGVETILADHSYLERRYTELKMQHLKIAKYKLGERSRISQEGNRVKFKLELIREFMDKMYIEYVKNVDL